MWIYGILLILTCSKIILPISAGTIAPSDDDKNVTLFINEINRWIKGETTPTFRKMINELAIPTEFQRLDWSTFTATKAKAFCIICKSLSKTVIGLRRSGTSIDSINYFISTLCTLLNLQTEKVCHGVVKLNTPILMYIVDNDPTLTEYDVCSLVLQNQECCEQSKRYQWQVDVNSDPPQSIEYQSSSEHFKILQVTDIHYDPLYEPNGNAACDEPTCCRKGQNTSTSQQLAGFWGDFNNCDVPWHSVVDALDHMRDQQNDIDFVYFTGDIIDHGVWETSREGNTESLILSFNKIKQTFGDLVVYPILGNHEPHPLNVFSPTEVEEGALSTRWLYELLADLWIGLGWLPESTRGTILRGGFYTVSPRKGFRIIAINNNVAYIFNWWLIYKPVDMDDQLKWLAEVLLEAERNNEFVHILGHIPPGASQCQHTWSREYRKIINRFSHIITGQFNGHTHNDEFNVFYHPERADSIINVAWNGGSITPYANLNPNYKVYHVNSVTYMIEDIDMWIYNLTEANENINRRPNWFKLYSFAAEYGLENLSYDSMHNLIVEMTKGSLAVHKYHRNFYKHAAPELNKPCEQSCLIELLCKIVTSSSNEKKECANLQNLP